MKKRKKINWILLTPVGYAKRDYIFPFTGKPILAETLKGLKYLDWRIVKAKKVDLQGSFDETIVDMSAEKVEKCLEELIAREKKIELEISK